MNNRNAAKESDRTKANTAIPAASNQDQILKLRTRRILWAQGYHCPLEVDLSHFEYDDIQQSLRRSSFTDIDLLAIRFDPDLRKRVVVADCKSGGESEPNRLFWLRGVMSFFGADEGLLVKTAVRAPARALAPRLGIRVLDEEALEILEQAVKVETHSLHFLGDKTIDDQIRNLWGVNIPKEALKNAERGMLYCRGIVEAIILRVAVGVDAPLAEEFRGADVSFRVLLWRCDRFLVSSPWFGKQRRLGDHQIGQSEQRM